MKAFRPYRLRNLARFYDYYYFYYSYYHYYYYCYYYQCYYDYHVKKMKRNGSCHKARVIPFPPCRARTLFGANHYMSMYLLMTPFTPQ